MTNNLLLRGRVQIRNARTGQLLAENKNVVVEGGLFVFASTIGGVSGYSGAAWCAIGTGTTTPLTTDTALGTESSRCQVTSSSAAGGTVLIQTYFLAANCGYNIKELGLFGGPTASATANSGTLIAHVLASYDNSSSPVDLMVTWAITLMSSPNSAPYRFEYLNTGDYAAAGLYGVYWKAQTFTNAIAHTMYSVKLKAFTPTGSPGTLTVSIRAVDSANKPMGSDLCIGTTNANTLTNGEWREIVLYPTISLTALTKYAIVLRALTGNDSNFPYFWYAGVGHYANGEFGTSDDSGSTWSMYEVGSLDLLFEELGY